MFDNKSAYLGNIGFYIKSECNAIRTLIFYLNMENKKKFHQNLIFLFMIKYKKALIKIFVFFEIIITVLII